MNIVDARPVDINLLCEKKHVEEVEEVVGEWRFARAASIVSTLKEGA